MPAPAKKHLKQYINENGFFLHLNAINEIAREEVETLDNAVRTSARLPEGDNVQVFRGLASQNFPKGKKSRNGYKYDHSGWVLNDYKRNPAIFLSHNDEMPIGKMLSIDITEAGMEVTYFVDYATKAGKEYEHELRNGYISMLSTGALTREWMIEDNRTGKRYTREEAREAGIDLWSVLIGASEDYTMVVTKAELIEVSMVAVGSNAGAFTAADSLKSYFQNIMTKDEALKNELTAGAGETPAETPTPQEAPVSGTETGDAPAAPETAQQGEGENIEATTPPALATEAEADGETDAGETPAAEAPAAETTPQAAPAPAPAEDGLPKWAQDILPALANVIASLEQEVKTLKRKVDSVPVNKPLVLTNQLAEAAQPPKAGALTNMLKGFGVDLS
jgi:hypothetical protein